MQYKGKTISISKVGSRYYASVSMVQFPNNWADTEERAIALAKNYIDRQNLIKP